ncbi:MAG: hypothetical protein HY550_04440 [Elusimicrobia bacterium]|nr:hypothetical protein [Elusimicrobiota bacterium]
MKNLARAVAAVVLSFNFVSGAFAAESEALRSAGLELEAAPLPEVPAPAAETAVPAEAPDLDLFRYFGYGESPKSAGLFMEKGMKGIEKESLFSIKLDTIRNAYLKPAIAFTTGAGTKVHISGTKASNCPDGGNSCADKEKFFLVLTTAGNESYFVRAMDIVNWSIFMSGSKTVTIDGEKYVVKVHANASTPENSKLEIKGPRGVALSVTLKQVGDGVAAKGVDVKLGKAYKLAYGNEIVQGPQGAKFTEKMLLLMIPFPVVDANSYYIFNASEIRPSGVTFPSFEQGYGFRLEEGLLDIYKL